MRPLTLLVPLALLHVALTAAVALLPGGWRSAPLTHALLGLAIGAVGLAGLAVVRRHRAALSSTATGVIIVAALAAGVIAALGMPPSDDVARYVVEGRQLLAGQNPYRVPPAAPEARALVAAKLADAVNHPEMTAIYPPAALALHAAVAAIAPRPGAHQALAVVAMAALLGLSVALLRAHGLPSALVIAVGWNPVLPLWGCGEAHGDLPMAAVAVGALVLAARRCPGWAVATASIALLLKPFAVATLPAVLAAAPRRRWLLPTLVVLAYLPFASAGPGLVTSLLRFGGTMHFHGVIEPWLRHAAMALGGASDEAVRPLVAAVLVGGLAAALIVAVRRWRDAPAPVLALRCTALLLLFLPTLHPWYLLLLVALLPFACGWALPLWAALMPLYWLHGLRMQLTGKWCETPWLTLVAHLPVLALLMLEAWRSHACPLPTPPHSETA